MTVTLDWWAVPTAFTFAAYVLAWWLTPEPKPGGYIPDFMPGIVGGFCFLVATIASLAVWLVWALLR